MEGKSSSNTNENTSHEESQEQGAVAKTAETNDYNV